MSPTNSNTAPIAWLAISSPPWSNSSPGSTARSPQPLAVPADLDERVRISVIRADSRNRPPPWATDLVAQRVEQDTFLILDGKLAALLPIRVQSECLVCHGPQEDILPDVAEALAKHYPQDQATGFNKDDLRGWFWVEVPPGE